MNIRIKAIYLTFILVSQAFLGNFAFSLPDCNDVLIIFARGSGQPQEESREDLLKKPQREAFFNEIKARAPAGLKVGTRELEYPARGDWKALASAPFNWTDKNLYHDSAEEGVANAFDLITSETARCPNQKIVLGGFSQGAQVMGDVLHKLGNVQRDRIAFVGLFGDPRFDSKSYAARGTFSRKAGVLGARKNDFPSDMRGRVFSWCKKNDSYCENNLTKKLRGEDTHSTYQDHEIALAANQAALALRGSIPDFKTMPVAATKDAKLDVVFIFDTGTPTTDSLSRIKNNALSYVDYVRGLSDDTRIGVVEYRHQKSSRPTVRTKQLLSGDRLLSRDAIQAVDQWEDWSDLMPLYAAVSEALNTQPWRPDARKLIVYHSRLGVQNPDGETGLTDGDIIRRANEVGPVAFYPVLATDYPPFVATHDPLVAGSGGATLTFPTIDRFEAARYFSEALTRINLQPRITPNQQIYTGRPGAPLSLNLSGSYDPDSTLDTFEWDVNGDGTYDITTTTPALQYSFGGIYEGNVFVRASSLDGGRNVIKIPVSVNETHAVPQAPLSPRNLEVSIVPEQVSATWLRSFAVVGSESGAKYTARLSWDPPSSDNGSQIEGYIVYGNGEILGFVPGDTREATVSGVVAGTLFGVVAVNEAGSSNMAPAPVIEDPLPAASYDDEPSANAAHPEGVGLLLDQENPAGQISPSGSEDFMPERGSLIKAAAAFGEETGGAASVLADGLGKTNRLAFIGVAAVMAATLTAGLYTLRRGDRGS